MQQVTFHGMVGSSRIMQRLYKRIRKVAPYNIPVLISGESGTGKELVARAVHAESDRRSGPFHAVNTGALTPELINSELFGHEKGSFTGASDKKRGFFEIAEGGTLFLDEIGTMEASTQVNLLRVIESKQYVRVGGTQVQNTNARILAATNLNLLKAVQTSEFRRDLYYRLNVFALRLAPLRERPEDIPLLVEYFRQHYVSSYDCHVTGIEPEAMRLLQSYTWPGNVRELSNVMTQLVIGAGGKQITFDEVQEALEANSLPQESAPQAEYAPTDSAEVAPREAQAPGGARTGNQEVNSSAQEGSPDASERTHSESRDSGSEADRPLGVEPEPEPQVSFAGAGAGGVGGLLPGADNGAFDIQAGQTIERVEEELIQTTLRSVNGNRSKAARMLGISRKSLYNKIKAYDIEA